MQLQLQIWCCFEALKTFVDAIQLRIVFLKTFAVLTSNIIP